MTHPSLPPGPCPKFYLRYAAVIRLSLSVTDVSPLDQFPLLSRAQQGLSGTKSADGPSVRVSSLVRNWTVCYPQLVTLKP